MTENTNMNMSNFDFRKVAEKSLSLCPLMAGREQLKTEDLLGMDTTVIAFDFAQATNEKGETNLFAVVVFKEDERYYYNGGKVLTNLCQAWAQAFDGDIEEASRCLREYGGVKLKFEVTRTKKGNTLTSVKLAD